SLTLLLLAVVWGIRTTAGMMVGGMLFGLSPWLQQHFTHPREAFQILVGLAAVGVAQNPEGTFGGHTPLQRWRDRRAAGTGTPDADPATAAHPHPATAAHPHPAAAAHTGPAVTALASRALGDPSAGPLLASGGGMHQAGRG